MVGSPGVGKTLWTCVMPGILSEIIIEGSLDVTRIHSMADQLPAGTPLIRYRPFRAHTIRSVVSKDRSFSQLTFSGSFSNHSAAGIAVMIAGIVPRHFKLIRL